MRSIFVANGEKRYPRVGELIRNFQTGNYINLVIDVGPLENITDWNGEKLNWVVVKSVRFAATNGGNCKRLDGLQARSFRWKIGGNWEIVDEFRKIDNSLECSIRYDQVIRERAERLRIFRERQRNAD